MMNVRTIAITISVLGICFSGAYSSSDMRMPNIPGPKGPQADPETCVDEDVGNSFWSYGTTAPATGSGPPTQAVSCIALPKARIGELKKIKCEVSQPQHVPHQCISWGLTSKCNIDLFAAYYPFWIDNRDGSWQYCVTALNGHIKNERYWHVYGN